MVAMSRALLVALSASIATSTIQCSAIQCSASNVKQLQQNLAAYTRRAPMLGDAGRAQVAKQRPCVGWQVNKTDHQLSWQLQ
jgi:hypothetical protein